MVTVTSSSYFIFLQAQHLGACPFFFFPSFLESRLVGIYFKGHLKGGPVLFLFLSL